jgi:TPR repeat protein
LHDAAKKRVFSSFFYLGLMRMEGFFCKKDPRKAVEYFTMGAAKNNAYCFFELSRIFGEGKYIPQDIKLSKIYLKRSAEEGFVMAQHMMGLAYHFGDSFK